MSRLMNRSILQAFAPGVAALALAVVGPVLAEAPRSMPDVPPKEEHHPWGEDHGKSHGEEVATIEQAAPGADVVVERDGARWDRTYRDVVLSYYDKHRFSCPQGLVQTGTGCLPDGESGKRYAIGQPLPHTVVVEPLPYDLMRLLPPPPSGYMYHRVDGDVLLVAEASNKVIDAVTVPPAS